ncbi:hypothetical protein HDU93_002221 [Gonapodya sp. JEL0774]|nr:hypothetical protein HDU93_002221 [Gonapodya sp. JEL0774]
MEHITPRQDGIPLGSYKEILERSDVPKDHGSDSRVRRSVRWKWAIGGVLALVVVLGVVIGVVVTRSKNDSPSQSSAAISGELSTLSAVATSRVTTASAFLITTQITTQTTQTTSTRTSTTTTRTVPTPSTSPAVLPPPGKFWFGATVNNNTDITVGQWSLGGRGGVKLYLGHVYFYLQSYNFTTAPQLADYMLGFFGGMPLRSVLMFTVQPTNGISPEEAPDNQIQALADAWRELNIRGYRILVRTGHEMNGGWYPWGRAYWIRFTTIVRATAPITSMVWSPTIGDTYPFDQRKVPAVGTDDMTLLDTNNNGQLDGGDDPYAPFYPGDEWVDYGPTFPYVDNFLPAGDWLDRIITGRVTLTGEQRGPSFYDVYCGQKNKPFVYSETAVFHWPNGQGVGELEEKQTFWRLMLNRTAVARFPMIRAVGWFEVAKIEEAWQNQFVDFTIGSKYPYLFGKFI